jgi:hypothetical protein
MRRTRFDTRFAVTKRNELRADHRREARQIRAPTGLVIARRRGEVSRCDGFDAYALLAVGA